MHTGHEVYTCQGGVDKVSSGTDPQHEDGMDGWVDGAIEPVPLFTTFNSTIPIVGLVLIDVFALEGRSPEKSIYNTSPITTKCVRGC